MKHLIILGDWARPIFRPAVEWLSARFEVRRFQTVSAAQAACDSDPPDVIVLAQSRPGQFSLADVERLHAAAPLSRLIALLGVWCEGETRTGQPCPGVTRVYWHQFVARLGNSEDPLNEPSWSLPRTSTDAERLFLATSSYRAQGGLIVIGTEDALTFDTLGEALADGGFATMRVRRGERFRSVGAIGGIWDCSASVTEDQADLERFVGQLAPSPVLSIVGFPRPSDFTAATAAGAAGVLGKPFLVADLLAEVSQLMGMPATNDLRQLSAPA